ncbi:MAG: Na-K-Cl cotransporter [Candidatus Schekmanbacteria bacterium]|nr:MAG: Na-K-Cl cotransporter [Candidatus Schekmanbacteria bacterium]
MEIPRKLNTFLGVFTPSILTILGVILYLRIGWVVGNAGLLPALAIIGLSNIISLVTALSVSAVATNMTVGVGGAYYIVSRSLGLEIGGAIGIPLYLSQVLSVTLYSFGLAESLRILFPNLPIELVAAIVVIAVTIISLKGPEITLKTQIPVLVLIFLSLLSLYAGTKIGEHQPILWGDYPDAKDFWTVFAVFFPAVTGILAGVSMSGDLKNPQKAIPLGTLCAVIVGFIVYLTVPFVLAFSADNSLLLNDSLVWTKVAVVPLLVIPGLWGAIFSSAVGSILAAPRTLQALANDRVVPSLFAKYQLKSGESIPSIILSSTLALCAVLLGNLNAVAPFVTIFFLTTYGMINLVAGLEKLVADPYYRPSINVPSFLSLAGALACFWVMFVISKSACILAIISELVIWALLRRREMRATWGDLRRGLWLSLARYALLNLKTLPENPRNWRPHILLFAGDVEKRINLVRFASWLNHDRGILTVCNLVEKESEDDVKKIEEEEKSIDHSLNLRQLVAFSEVNVVEHFEEGIINMAQTQGIAGLTSNTLMFGWSNYTERLASYLRIMRRVSHLGKSVIIAEISKLDIEKKNKKIDIWWRGKQHNGDLMLLLAYLLSLNNEWRRSTITVKSIVSSELSAQEMEKNLSKLIPSTRIPAERKVILRDKNRDIEDMMKEESFDADVVFLGLKIPETGTEMQYAKRIEKLVSGFSSVVLVRNSGKFVGELV